jgi:MFS family permease
MVAQTGETTRDIKFIKAQQNWVSQICLTLDPFSKGAYYSRVRNPNKIRLIKNMSFLPTLKHGTAILLARLLQTDRPVPSKTESELEAERDRNYRWNFVVTTFDTSAFGFGASLISASTIVPLFISKLTTSTLPIGLAAMIAGSSWFLPQLFSANFTEQVARKKPIVANLGFFTERLPLFFIILSAAIAIQAPNAALILFLVSFAWHGFGAGLLAPAWQEMVARCSPVEKRGRYLGTGMFIGMITGVAGASLSTRLLSTLEFPNSFLAIFSLGTAGIMISWIFLVLTREPVNPNHTLPRTQREYVKGVGEIIKKKFLFRRFLIARTLLALGTMGSGFITISALRTWQVSDGTVGVYTALLLAGQGLGVLFLSLLADRKGHKLSLELVGIASAISFAFVWLAKDPVLIFPAFLFLGISYGGITVSGLLVVLEFADPNRRPTYAGIASFGVGLANIIAPLIGTALAEFSFSWVFGLSVVLSLVGWIVLHFWVREPRYAPEISGS